MISNASISAKFVSTTALTASLLLVGCVNQSANIDNPSNRADTVTQPHTLAGKRPNIIYILADDLGYGDLGIYGQEKIKTPHLDQLASEGIRFTQHYAGSTVCGPSRASLLTGLHPGNSPIRGNPRWTASGNPVEVSQDDILVSEVLKEAGYQTAVIGKWGMADGKTFNLEAMPNQNGFDYSFVYKTHKDAHHYYWDTLYRNNEKVILEGNDYWTNTGKYTHDLFTEDALNYLTTTDKDTPFFLFLAYTIPHLSMTVPDDSKVPYKNLGWPERIMKNSNRPGSYRHDREGHTAYAGMVSRMDRDIGRLVSTLQELGIEDDTLIIFTSDNGHEFDKVNNEFFDSNGPLRGKKRDLYEGGIRVPMMAKWTNNIRPGQVTDHISSFWDFMATACDLAGTDCPDNDGISFVPTLAKDQASQKQHDFLYWEFNERQGPIQAVRSGKWKLIKFKEKKT